MEHSQGVPHSVADGGQACRGDRRVGRGREGPDGHRSTRHIRAEGKAGLPSAEGKPAVALAAMPERHSCLPARCVGYVPSHHNATHILCQSRSGLKQDAHQDSTGTGWPEERYVPAFCNASRDAETNLTGTHHRRTSIRSAKAKRSTAFVAS